MDNYYDQQFEELNQQNETIRLQAESERYRQCWLTWEDVRMAQRQGSRAHSLFTLSESTEWHEQLAGVWGNVGPGELTLVAGEHGSGKSLLLNILAGNVKTKWRRHLLTGRVLVNGEHRGQFWRRICAHVSQDLSDLQELLTVQEHLNYRAALALPSRWGQQRRQFVVDTICAKLDLKDLLVKQVKHLNLNQKRRLKLAQALVCLPRVLLLDEPTTGLDPTAAFVLMKALREMANERKLTVIISVKDVRQSILPFVDKILLLCQGRQAFFGSVTEGINFFERYLDIHIPLEGDNPLSCMLDAINCKICQDNPDHLSRIQRSWAEYVVDRDLHVANYPQFSADDSDTDKFKWHRSWVSEYKIHLNRIALTLFRDRTHWIGQTLLLLLLGLMVAFSAFQVSDEGFGVKARLDVLYYTAVFFQFFPFIPFLFVCRRETLVLKLERRDSISRASSAYLALWTVIYSFRFLLVTLYSYLVYFIVGLRLPFNYFLVFWLALAAECWVAMGMGYLLVTLIKSMAAVETAASLILLVCIWFSGGFAFNPTCTWILRWIAYLSPIFYTFNALVNNEFDGQTFTSSQGGKAITVGKKFLESEGYVNYGTWASIGTLLGFGFGYMILGYAALAIKTRPKRKFL